ncbi:hypothetical protein AB9K21_02355 [Anaplasma phagocytophilum]|uniref:Uncharacterized protein n=1 Tax=Anaplasma phagocytophilum str. ApNP TaxID=1359153 RepID=A0A0F3NFF9_ANAPH|nr:hypothetical protein APHNP_0129 [Anaplasma phagocytophilum str. ApNP]
MIRDADVCEMGKCLLLQQWPGFYAHVLDAARASAEVPTVPVAAFRQLFFYILTCISIRRKRL